MKAIIGPFPPQGGGGGAVAADQQPQWIPAGAWEPLSTNSILLSAPLEFTVGDNAAINCIEFPALEFNPWCFVTIPPVNWTSAQIKYIVHYIIIDTIATPQVVGWELRAERYTNNFDLDTIAYNSVIIADQLPDSNIPKYRITAESGILTVTGATATEAVQLSLNRDEDTESDAAYFVGLKLLFI